MSPSPERDATGERAETRRRAALTPDPHWTDLAEDPLEAATAHAAVGLEVRDPRDGGLLSANARFLELVGHSMEELRGRDALSLVHPDDRDASRALLQQLRAGERESFTLERRLVRKNGSVSWVRASTSLLRDREGRPARVVTLVEDVTEARTAALDADRFHEDALRARLDLEARLRQQERVAELGLDALRGVDLDHLLAKACRVVADVLRVPNAKVLELLPDRSAVRLRAGVGWAPGLVGQGLVSIGPESQAGYTLMSNAPVIVRDLRRETRFSGPPLLHDHGVVSGMSVVVQGRDEPWGVLGAHDTVERAFTQDDTRFLQGVANVLALAIERRRADDRLRALNEGLERVVAERTRELRDANGQLEAFAYTVAHDLRAPLRGVNALSQFALEDHAEEMPPDLRGQLERIRASSQAMGRLIEDLLSFARSGKGDLRVEEGVDVAALARDVAADLAARSPGREVAFAVSGPGEPPRVAADPGLVRVILDNLLSNAWKFTEGISGPRVEVGWLPPSAPDAPPVFYVRDNGVGFDAARAERLFQPFQRYHAGGRFQGTGVGLATVRRVVDRHGGRAWADSAPGEGATFYFTLGA